MFIETAIVLIVLGAGIGMVFAYLAAVRPLERRLRDIDTARLREARRARYAAERKHLGTPYISGGIREW